LGKIVKAQGWAGRLAYIKGQFLQSSRIERFAYGSRKRWACRSCREGYEIDEKEPPWPRKGLFRPFFSSGEGRESQAHDIKLAKHFENGIIEQKIYKKYTNK
jgi:hypothetical protein